MIVQLNTKRQEQKAKTWQETEWENCKEVEESRDFLFTDLHKSAIEEGKISLTL